MATAQPEIQQADFEPSGSQQLDWEKLARELNLGTAQEAAQRAYEIAAYIAEVERSKDQKLLLKDGSKFYTLTLSEISKGS
jgi:hypothetical protein